MVSTLPGEDGTRELVAFALRIGMRREWLQRVGTPHEHFDVFGSRRPRAVAAGAREVTRREIVDVFRAKRGQPPLARAADTQDREPECPPSG